MQALQQHEPEQWASLPDLRQKRQDYYAALEATNRSMIRAEHVIPCRCKVYVEADRGAPARLACYAGHTVRYSIRM